MVHLNIQLQHIQIQFWGGSRLKFCRRYSQGFQKTPTSFIFATYSFTAWAASSQTLLILINSSVRSRMGMGCAGGVREPSSVHQIPIFNSSD